MGTAVQSIKRMAAIAVSLAIIFAVTVVLSYFIGSYRKKAATKVAAIAQNMDSTLP